MWDLVLSIGLLCYGLLNVIAGMFQYSNVAGVINQAYELQGIGEFTSTDLATSVGVAINVVNIGLYLVTLVITVRLLRASKLSFYVPVIGGTLASIVTVVLLLVVVFNDPAFLDYLGSAG